MSNFDNSMWSEQTAGRFRVEAIPDSFKPYPHQESAWNAMARHYTDAGKQAGGTDEAYLVTFVDTWDEYSPLDTEVFIASGEPDALPDRDRVRGPLAIISAELIAEAYKLVQSVYRGLFDGVYECLPHSWFVWEEETELDLNRRLVLVFDNQREGYDRLQQELLGPRRLPDEITTEFAAQIRRDYFANCTDPLPSVGDLFALLSAHQKQQAVESYTFEEKDRFDPARLAVELRPFARDEQRARLRQIFDNDPVCRLVYKRDFESFEEDVQRAITRLVAGSSPSPLAAPQLVEPALVELRSWPTGDPGYALGRVWDAVTSEKRHFPRCVPAISDCSYSDRPLTNLWGFFRYADRKLVISSTLNSPDVPRFVVEFLMNHEALHADMPNSGHNAEFRQRERRFIPSAEAVEDAKQRNFAPGAGAESWRALADQFLDTFPRRFSVGSTQSKLNY